MTVHTKVEKVASLCFTATVLLRHCWTNIVENQSLMVVETNIPGWPWVNSNSQQLWASYRFMLLVLIVCFPPFLTTSVCPYKDRLWAYQSSCTLWEAPGGWFLWQLLPVARWRGRLWLRWHDVGEVIRVEWSWGYRSCEDCYSGSSSLTAQDVVWGYCARLEWRRRCFRSSSSVRECFSVYGKFKISSFGDALKP